MTDLVDVRTDFVRDRWGRPMIAGKAYNRASSIAKPITDTWNLEMWARRNIVYGMAHDPSLVARCLALGGDPSVWDKDRRDQAQAIVDDAAGVALGHKGADIGTALHTMTEQADLGESVTPGIYAPDLDAYRAAMEAAGLEVELVECRIVNHELQAAGTADRIVRRHGTARIADIKTGRSVDYGALDWSAQLAVYAGGELWDVTAEMAMATPEIDRDVGYIIHLPAGRGECTIYELNLTMGRQAAVLANRVREMQRQSKAWIGPLSAAQTVVGSDDREQRRTRLRERWNHLSDESKVTFRERIVDRDDLDQVEALLDELDPSRRRVGKLLHLHSVQAQRPPGVHPSQLSDERYAGMQTRLKALDADSLAWLQQVARQAGAGGGSISARFEPFERNLALSLALVSLARAGCNEDHARTLASAVLDDPGVEQPAIPLGAVLVRMDADQAGRFREMCELL